MNSNSFIVVSNISPNRSTMQYNITQCFPALAHIMLIATVRVSIPGVP